MKKYLSLVFVMILALVLVGCGGGSDDSDNFTIRVVGKQTLVVGSSETYKAEFNPADYANKEVTWSTSDEAALTITATGKATANQAKKDGVYVYATSVANSAVKGQKRVHIKDAADNEGEYPDLNGYNIKIAQAEHALGDFDPNHPNYNQLNKAAKQKAWEEVENLFNCTITVDPYPSHADWGPSRWKYITDQAAEGVSDFDFLTVPDSRIGRFVDAGALISVSDFYTVHGKEMMDPSFIASGSFQGQLYGLCEGQNNIYAVMYYNIGLFEELQKQDPTLVEPAQLFNEGKWTYDTFTRYCKQVQDAMAAKFGAEGTANDKAQKYFAAAGYDAYWFAGLSSNDGDPMANIKTMKINLASEHRQAAADVVKEIYTKGYADPKQSVDQNVVSWNEGRAFFNTGDLWFVGNAGRWKKDLWGEGSTKYGYVPWPMPNDMRKEDYKIGLGGTALWVMPIGREYDEFGEDCTPENIYWAVAEMIQRTKKYYEEDTSYDKDEAMKSVAAKYAQSVESQKAYIEIQKMIEDGKGYYDPLVVNDNPVGSLYQANGNTIRAAVNDYAVKGTATNWAEAITTLVPVLQEALTKAFN